MRSKTIHTFGIAVVAIILASCAQQPTHDARVQTAPTAAAPAKSDPGTATAPKPKPKPKPAVPKPDAAVPKPETKESDVKEPEVARADGIDKAQVGYYFDTLQGRLRQSGDPKIVVSRRDSHITIDVTDRVPSGSDEAAACAALEPIAKALVEYRMTRVVVDVSAEETAGPNAAKSAAEALARCLAAAGVANKRIATKHTASAPRTSVYLRIDPIVKTP